MTRNALSAKRRDDSATLFHSFVTSSANNETLICIDLSNGADWVDIFLLLQCAERRAGGVTTIDQSDMRGLDTA